MTRSDNRRLDYRLGGIYKQPRKRPKTLRCGWCKEKFKVGRRGRLPDFCSHSCRQRAYERSKWGPGLREVLARDLATVRGREVIRAEIWTLLKQLGLVSEPNPPPPPRKPPRPSHLRVVK